MGVRSFSDQSVFRSVCFLFPAVLDPHLMAVRLGRVLSHPQLNAKMRGRTVSPLSLHNCFLVIHVTCRVTGSVLRLFVEVQRVVCLDVVIYNILIKATSMQVALTELPSWRWRCPREVFSPARWRSTSFYALASSRRLGLDLVLKMDVDDAMLSGAVETCIRF